MFLKKEAITGEVPETCLLLFIEGAWRSLRGEMGCIMEVECRVDANEWLL